VDRKSTLESESSSTTTYIQMTTSKQTVNVQPTINEAPNEEDIETINSSEIEPSNNDIVTNSPAIRPTTPMSPSQ